jgi:hypothetical protein
MLRMLRAWIQRTLGVLLAALVMIWPALYNGFPFFYPDSTGYLDSGNLVARALFQHNFSDYYGMRSLIYSLGILPLHWNITPWPVVIFSALLTAYVLWLVVRSLLPRHTLIIYLGLVIFLSFLTAMSWTVSWIMPDILGPVLYLCIYLLVFCWDELKRTERVMVMLIAWWAVTSHATHFVLAVGLYILLIPVLMLQRQPARQWLKATGRVVAVIAAAALAQMLLHAYLYGKPTLNGNRPPFLLARVIADGPGRWYLEKRCPELHFAICDHVRELPNNVDDILWDQKGAWASAPLERQEQMLAEEMPIVRGAVLAYPRDEFTIASARFWEQLQTFGYFDFHLDTWVPQTIETSLPGSLAHYMQSRQGQDTLPEDFFTDLQNWTVIASIIVICVWALLLRRNSSCRLAGLTAVIVFSVLANAAVTGMLSNVEDRYQVRVVWLVPLLAGIFLLAWLDNRRHPGAQNAPGVTQQSVGRDQPAIPST